MNILAVLQTEDQEDASAQGEQHIQGLESAVGRVAGDHTGDGHIE